MELILAICLIVLCGVLGIWEYGRTRVDASPVEWADREFRQLLVDAPDPALCFDGRSATVVHEERAYLEDPGSQVTEVRRYAQNSRGEYFFFISTGSGKPYFKHISQAAARAALGKRYVAPPGDAA